MTMTADGYQIPGKSARWDHLKSVQTTLAAVMNQVVQSASPTQTTPRTEHYLLDTESHSHDGKTTTLDGG